MALLRIDNPEASLQELGELVNPPLGRSGVNHRLQRLMDYAAKIKS
jgi:DNA-binding protein WhiA